MEGTCHGNPGTCYHGDRDDDCEGIADGELYDGMIPTTLDGRPAWCADVDGVPTKVAACYANVQDTSSDAMVFSAVCTGAFAACAGGSFCFDHDGGNCNTDGTFSLDFCSSDLTVCKPCFPFSRCGALDTSTASFADDDGDGDGDDAVSAVVCETGIDFPSAMEGQGYSDSRLVETCADGEVCSTVSYVAGGHGITYGSCEAASACSSGSGCDVYEDCTQTCCLVDCVVETDSGCRVVAGGVAALAALAAAGL